jgi:hypothetical protein
MNDESNRNPSRDKEKQRQAEIRQGQSRKESDITER